MPVGKKEIFITFRVSIWLRLSINFYQEGFDKHQSKRGESVLMCQVQKSPVFRRDGADIHSDLHVSVAQAILGGTARTQGLYETLNLSVR